MEAIETRIAEIICPDIHRQSSCEQCQKHYSIKCDKVFTIKRILALFTEQQVEALDVAFDKGFDTGKVEGQIEAKQQQTGLVEALESGKNEIWRLRHESTERPERTLNVIKQMNAALKEARK